MASIGAVKLPAARPCALNRVNKCNNARRCQKAAIQPIGAAGATNPSVDETTGFETMRKGVKVAAKENILTPRFYTTDFEEMEKLFSLEINPNLDMSEIEASLQEFKNDYNQTHFVRNESFKKAADNIQGDTRKIFIEFLERSCTAEFSGFLLYKELGRRLKKINPAVAEIFVLLSRDEARHAGFLNKALSDFNLALDLGFLTKNRTYTYFSPKFIVYATFLSEKIGYWRYITIYRHLQKNPQYQLYPLFEYFENWCQDENRHGDFLAAVLKAHPQLLNDWKARFWSRFFCLSVYVTMYLNDHQRQFFYETLGLNTTEFDMHVIHETNKTAARIFPEVLDTYNPKFKQHMDNMVAINEKLVAIDKNNAPDMVKKIQKLPHMASMTAELLTVFLMKPIDAGTVDLAPSQASMVY